MRIRIVRLSGQDATLNQSRVRAGNIQDRTATQRPKLTLVATAQAIGIDPIIVGGALVQIIERERQSGRYGPTQTDTDLTVLAHILVVITSPAKHGSLEEFKVSSSRTAAKSVGKRKAPRPAWGIPKFKRRPQPRHPVGFEKHITQAASECVDLAKIIRGADHPIRNA